MLLVWLVAAVDVAAAVFAAWLALELDFSRTGLNVGQVLAGLVAAMLVLTAITLASPRWPWSWKASFALEAIALASVLAVSLWTAFTARTTSNPMWFYWRHCSALAALFAMNLGALWFVAARAP